MSKKCLTYISLFSSGGIGCYGFKLENYECIATVELIKRRLEIQKINNKCKYDTGYINGDATDKKVKEKIDNEIKLWKVKEKIDNVDVLISTPPCQGMSNANSKKNEKDIFRNSLVVDSVNIVLDVNPNFFIFENVPSFMKTNCISGDRTYKIGEYIYKKLSNHYSIYHDVINFKDYNVPSNRTRCIVIGVKKELSLYISPLELFPNYTNKKKTIRECIYNLPRLSKMGDICDNDIYHFFRSYEPRMREWIKDLKPGESAYDNDDISKIPHKILNGSIIPNTNKMGGKYKRQEWDDVAKCIHTRNDQLASQNTIHPEDDRVFSIRELMYFMTIDKSFKWSYIDEKTLNSLSFLEKKEFLKKNEINIRQLLGEAVPTIIFKSIAKNIKESYKIIEIIKKIDILEKNNPNRVKNGAFYTDKFIVNEIIKVLPNFKDKNEINILEPSVGLGSFLPLLLKKYERKKINLFLIDIDKNTIKNLKKYINKLDIFKKNDLSIKYICADFLLYDFKNIKFDLVIGNPPFIKIDKNQKEKYKNIKELNCNDIISFFIYKSLKISNFVSLVLPKNFLTSPKYNVFRNYLSNYKIKSIIDFETIGFKDVILETISICLENKITSNNEIEIRNVFTSKIIIQDKKYITSNRFPNWIIYRDNFFDSVLEKIQLNIFSVFRDRQLTNKYMSFNKTENCIKVLRSRNISSNGDIIEIKGYDKYIKDLNSISKFNIYKFLKNGKNIFLCPNFTPNIRVIKKPINTLVNGSLAILMLKENIRLNKNDLEYFSNDEFIKFYKYSNNFQKNTLNLDKNSVFYFGKQNKL